MNRTVTPTVATETSIEVQRLAANIHHLKGQLFLASAALQQKEFFIQQQQALIQQQLVSGQVLVQSLRERSEKDEDAEPLGTNIIRVKRWSVDSIPFEVNLPELLRRLKDKFGRKQLP